MGEASRSVRARFGEWVHTLEYRALVTTAGWARGTLSVSAWTHWWIRRTPRMRGESRVRLHGRMVRMNTGFAYPAFMRRWPQYNEALPDLARAVKRQRAGGLTVVDAGAAIGDTVLLLVERVSELDDTYICIEPDPESRAHLVENVARPPHVEVHYEMLSYRRDGVPTPIRIHWGTASPKGTDSVPATTLDSILRGRHVAVLKIDTDGFDGKVLGGSSEALPLSAPAVNFHWHPTLLAARTQLATVLSNVLSRHRYRIFVWFTKDGDFSLTESPNEPAHTATLAEMCLDGEGPEPDWHYDVVALLAAPEDPVPNLVPADRLALP